MCSGMASKSTGEINLESERVENFLRRDTLANARPLHAAAAHGHYGVVKVLLKSGAEAPHIYCRDDAGNTALHLAAGSGSVHILEAFLSQTKSNLDCPNGKHQTPLHFAAGHGRLDAIRFLLQNGADKNACDEDGATPFHLAASSGHTSAMEELFPDITVIDKKMKDGSTALHHAAWNGHRAALEWLLLCGAPVNAKDALLGNTPLHWAVKEHCTDVIETLLKWGAAVQEVNKGGSMPLDLVDELKLEHVGKAISKALPNITDPNTFVFPCDKGNNFLLHYVAAYGNGEDLVYLAQCMERQSGSLDVKNKKGETAVHWAAREGNMDVIQSLPYLNNMELLEAKDLRGQMPLGQALSHQRTEFARQFISILGGRFNMYQWSKEWAATKIMAFGHAQRVECLLERKELDKQIGLEYVLPVLWIALETGEECIAKFIQEFDKTAVNQRDGILGRTVLHWAAIFERTNIIATLCRTKEFEQDMLPDLLDYRDKTALTYALERGNQEIIQELLQLRSHQSSIERLYKDRQVYVDSANAILVGAALITSVTFASWLQPPLSYTTETDPYKNHLEVRVFWVFNSLSFFFAIATVLLGAGTVLPMRDIDIRRAVSIIRQRLFYTALLLACSIIFVLGAFAVAGFADLLDHKANMIPTVAVGGFLCIYILCWYLAQLWALAPRWYPGWLWDEAYWHVRQLECYKKLFEGACN